jgi:hypothetical protein
MSPLDLAQSLAKSAARNDRVLGVAIVIRGLTDDEPSTFRQGWPLSVTTAHAAATYLGIKDDSLLLDALDLAPTLSDAILNKGASDA